MTADRDKDDVARLEEEVRDIERRLLSVETNQRVTQDEVMSLRSTRHEHANWLNRHNLEIDQLQTRTASVQGSLQTLIMKVDSLDREFTTKVDGLNKEFTRLELAITSNLITLKGELKNTMWIVSAIVGLIVFLGRMIANKFGF